MDYEPFLEKLKEAKILFYDKEFFWLAIIGILNSVISLYYYFRIVKAMYFVDETKPKENVKCHPVIYWSIIILSAQNLLFYIYLSDLYEFINGIFQLWNIKQ